jgi:hypothetical protein
VDKKVGIDTEKHNVAKLPRRKNLIYLATKLGFKRPLFRLVPDAYKKSIKDSFFIDNKKPELNIEEVEFIRNFYKDDINKLSGLIKRDLSNWM